MEESAHLFPEINFEECIRKGKLIYKLTFDIVIIHILYYFVSLFLIGGISLFVIVFFQMMANGAKDVLMLAIVITSFVACDILIIINFFFLNKLVCISGFDPETNKKKMKKLLNSLYNDIDSCQINEDSIKYFRRPDLANRRRITTLYNGNNVYINITTLGSLNKISCFHGYLNYLKCKRISVAFSKNAT